MAVSTDEVGLTVPPHRTLRTVEVYLCVFAVGLGFCVIGPTLVSMEILLEVTTREMVYALLSQAVGYCLGSFITGVLYGRVNKDLALSGSVFVMAVALAAAPFTGNIFGYIGCIAVSGLALGFIDSACQVYIIWLWQGHKYIQSLIQGMRANMTIGLTVAPFMVRAFLPDLSILSTVTNITLYQDNGSTTHQITVLDDLREQYTNDTKPRLTAEQLVEVKSTFFITNYAYLAVGVLLLFPSAVCVATYFVVHQSPGGSTREKKAKQTSLITEKRHFRVKVLLMSAVMIGLAPWYQLVPAGYLASFVIKGLGHPNKNGAWITSLYYASQLVGRFIAIPMSAFLSAKALLTTNLTITLAGLVGMCFSHYHESVIWVSTVIVGLGSSPIFPTIITWAASHVTFNGRAGSVMFIGVATGMMVSLYSGGYMFETFGHMSMVYSMLAASLLITMLFILAECYVSIKRHKATESTNI